MQGSKWVLAASPLSTVSFKTLFKCRSNTAASKLSGAVASRKERWKSKKVLKRWEI